jgi:hypothetical protein
MSKKKIDIKKMVMEKIENRQIKMRPRLYFISGSFIIGLGTIILILTASLTVNMIAYKLDAVNASGIANLGLWGWRIMLRVIPWNQVFVASLLLGLGTKLISKYEFSYKKGLTWMILGMIVGVIGLSSLMNKYSVRKRLPGPSVKKLYQIKEIPPQTRNELLKRGWKPGAVKGLTTPDTKLRGK